MVDNLLEEVFSIIDEYSGKLTERDLLKNICDKLYLSENNIEGNTFEDRVISLMEARERLIEYKMDALTQGTIRKIKDAVLEKSYKNLGDRTIQLGDVFANVLDLGTNSVSFSSNKNAIIPYCTPVQLLVNVYNAFIDNDRTRIIELPSKVRLILFWDSNNKKWVKPLVLGSTEEFKKFVREINNHAPWNENIFQFIVDTAKQDIRLKNIPIAPAVLPKFSSFTPEKVSNFELGIFGEFNYLKEDIQTALSNMSDLNLMFILQDDLYAAIKHYVLKIPVEDKIKSCKTFINILKSKVDGERELNYVKKNSTDDFLHDLTRRQSVQSGIDQSNDDLEKARNAANQQYS